jgi:hypothetical protein
MLMKEIRMTIFVYSFKLILNLVPSDAMKTLRWVVKMPYEDFTN